MLLPDHVDPHWLCEQAAEFAGEVALANMPRLLPMLAANKGHANYHISFTQDEEGRHCVKGKVQGSLELVCQRCLQPMAFPVEITFCLSLVNGPQEAEQLPDEYDPLLIEEPRLRPMDIIEDELILAVPTAPKHKETHCEVDLVQLNQPVPIKERPAPNGPNNPFAVLAHLKNKDSKS